MALSIGLDTAASGLRAMQVAIDTAAHNVANADTEGYSRQVVEFRAVPPVRDTFTAPGISMHQLGLGVDSGRISRIRDLMLDQQYRGAHTLQQEYETRSTAIGQAEIALNEPSDQGLQAMVSRLFNAFRDLSSQPEGNAARAAAIEQGATLAAGFNRTATLLTNQRVDLDGSVAVKVSEVNNKATQVASLNSQIRIVTIAGGTANDLEDRRDLLLDQLAGLAGATSEVGPGGQIDVYIGTRKLVDNVTVNALKTQPDPANDDLNAVVWAADSAAPDALGGDLKGTIDARDVQITSLLASINELAGSLITAVNTEHQAGYGLDNSTGLDFFTGTDAATIGINTVLRDDPQKLATSSGPDEPGNADAARAIAGVQSQRLLNGGTSTIDDAYRGLVTRLGVDGQQAELLAGNQEVVQRHLDAARASVSGVSIDEEMTNLMKGQHAYQAAARVISVIDEMLDTLVNRTG